MRFALTNSRFLAAFSACTALSLVPASFALSPPEPLTAGRPAWAGNQRISDGRVRMPARTR